MRELLVALGLVALAFGLGMTGVPGDALSAATGWLVDEGHVELRGPVGEAVEQAM